MQYAILKMNQRIWYDSFIWNEDIELDTCILSMRKMKLFNLRCIFIDAWLNFLWLYQKWWIKLVGPCLYTLKGRYIYFLLAVSKWHVVCTKHKITFEFEYIRYFNFCTDRNYLLLLQKLKIYRYFLIIKNIQGSIKIKKEFNKYENATYVEYMFFVWFHAIH